VSVTELTGPRDGEPDRRFVLTARKATVRLDSAIRECGAAAGR